MADAPVAAETPAPPTPTTGKARWTWLASLGLLMAAIAPLFMLAVATMWGLDVGEEIGFFGTAGVVGLVGAFLVLRFGTWSKFVGILVALLMFMFLFWTAFGLFSPTSFFDFVPGTLVLPGVLIAIVSSISAIVAGRRGHTTATATGGEQRAIRIVLTVLIALAVLSGVLTFSSRTSVAEGDADAVVTFSDFEFDADEYIFEAGTTVLVRNEDPFMHTFTIEELDIDEALVASDEVLIDIPDEPGTYTVFCRPHTTDPEEPVDEDDMAASLTIE